MAAAGLAGFRHLRLYFSQASGLKKGDMFGLSDPYVSVMIKGASKIHPSQKGFKTQTVKKSLTPQWNEELDFWILGDRFLVILDIYDENLLIKDDFLGRQVIYFDFNDTNPDTQPLVIYRPLPHSEDICQEGRKLNLDLADKYNLHLLRRYGHDNRIQAIEKEWRRKLGRKHYEHHNDWGRLTLSYVVEDRTESSWVAARSGRRSTSEVATLLEAHAGATPPATPPTTPASLREESDSDEEEELPEGWERRVDSNGRVVFLNHNMRRTSLRRPVRLEREPPPVAHRRYLNRHTSIDVIEEVAEEENEAEEQPPAVTEGRTLRTFSQMRRSEQSSIPEQPTPSEQPTPPVQPTPPTPVHQPTHTPAHLIPSQPAQPSAPPLQAAQTASLPPQTITLSGLERAAQSLPPQAFTPQFTTALQRAAQRLPPGWEAQLAPDGRIYFIDHHTRTTTWELPRVLERRPLQAERGANPGPVQQDPDLPPGWEMRKTQDGRSYYVNHNTRTTAWEPPHLQQTDPRAEELGPLPPHFEMKQMPDGRIFFMDHSTQSTQWEDPRLLLKNKPTARIQYSRDYKQKYMNFRSKLVPLRRIPNTFDFPVRRNHLFEDSYNAVMNVRDVEHLKARLYVRFEGETGLDYGGLAREWFYLLSHEMFNPYSGLFEYSASDDYTLQISPESATYNEHHLDYFKFIGRICGMAVYHNRLIDAFFIRPFYKMMLGKSMTVDDLQSVDVELYNSMIYILENDPEPLCLSFSANRTIFGEVIEDDLKPGGRNIDVTERNKKEYIDLLMKWRFTNRIRKQMDAFLLGFSELIPLRLIKVFDEREIEYLLGGLAQIDVEDWKRNTDLQGYYVQDRPVLWFWKAVENYDNEMRARLLQFVTGTSKVPMNGFAELQGSQGPRKFCIKKYGSPNSLPRAHTCFNRIDLPPYASYHKLKEMLQLAVENTEGFEGVD